MRTLLLATLLCLGPAATAQQGGGGLVNLPGGKTVVATTPFESDGSSYAVLHYTDGSTAVASTTGELSAVTTKDGEFVSEFTDSTGATHVVSTPKGRTEGSRKAAIERHAAAFKLMRAAFP